MNNPGVKTDMPVLRSGLRGLVAFLILTNLVQEVVASAGDRGTPTFTSIDDIMTTAVAEGTIPGGVVLIGHNGEVVYRKAFGSRSLEPTREPMTSDTIFDLASLTKCIATSTSMMRLVQDGRVRLNDPVATYLPEFAQNGKRDITIRELLTHYSGLAPDLDLKLSWHGREAAFTMAMQQTPAYPPGSRFLYSDINFEVLGFVIEKVSGMSLDDFASTYVFRPLGMENTRYLPPKEWLPRIAPTQYDEQGQMLRGVVHDPTARRMGGVAGHAGLFSTADDLAVYAQDLMGGFKVLSRQAVEKMSTPQQPTNAASLRGLGWDIDSPFASNRGDLLPVGSFGHTGFTGTSLWIDPITNTYLIILTNRVHPRGGTSIVSLRSRLATAMVQSLSLTATEEDRLRLSRITGYNETLTAARRLSVRDGNVRSGIDTLKARGFQQLHSGIDQPLRVGLVMNQTSVDAQGKRTADVLSHAPGIRVTAIFSPEHGIAGELDTTDIGNAYDAATGAVIYSVYGDSDVKRRPPSEALAGLDAIVYDIQDIGVRFYTYESTLGYFLEAAAKSGKPIVVLDRPNPIGGAFVQGPVADSGREAFTSYWQTPVREAMTIGELAKMFNVERGINANLTVVPMEGWMRGDWFDSTGDLWINPSPNIRSLTEATFYPGIGMIEDTNISVGRGTDTPFEVIGAPWIDSKVFANYLNARDISGVRFVPIVFTPNASNYANEKCGGVNLVLTDRDGLDSPELGAEIASALQHLYPSQYKIDGLETLMVNKASFDALVAGEDPRRVAEDWREGIDKFNAVRAKYLMY
jgi:uncharacterized protein YbbC (DUF1343 family)/CubicO group peptidase (beta-lactamase class C family)